MTPDASTVEARRRSGALAAEVRPLAQEAIAMAESIGAAGALADIERHSLPT